MSIFVSVAMEAMGKITYDKLLKEVVILRQELGVSQVKMGKLLNMDRSSYSRKENGLIKFSLDEYISISNFFHFLVRIKNVEMTESETTN